MYEQRTMKYWLLVITGSRLNTRNARLGGGGKPLKGEMSADWPQVGVGGVHFSNRGRPEIPPPQRKIPTCALTTHELEAPRCPRLRWHPPPCNRLLPAPVLALLR